MVFGSVASATSWEPFRRAIAALAVSYFAKRILVEKHRKYLDMLRWSDPPTSEVTYVQASACSKNPGIFNADGTEQPSQHNIYVDDNLMADTKRRLPFALASAIEAIFVIMGKPCLQLRPCAVAMDKWLQLRINPIQILLGLLFNTREMTVGITPQFRDETLSILTNTWHKGRRSFTIAQLELLVGKLGRIGQAYRPLYQLMPMLYASVAFALRMNDGFLYSTSKQYRLLIKKAKQRPRHEEDAREINFAIGQSARLLHSCDRKYVMPPSMLEEIEYITKLLRSDIVLASHIGHIVPRDPSWIMAADSCKRMGGGWSVDLKFFWHLPYKLDVIKRIHLPNNKSGLLISINVLEMLCVVINMCAAIFVCDHDKLDLSTHPVLLNFCDNTAACAWVNAKCKHSLMGRRLARFFIGLLMGTKIGVQAEWLSTHLNFIADDISRLKKSDLNGDYDYANLKKSYPVLAPCRQFQPSASLLGMLWEILLRGGSPDPLIVRALEPKTLGQFIS